MLKEPFTLNLSSKDRWLRVRRLWHNTFNDILNDPTDQYYQSVTTGLTANIGGEPNPALIRRLDELLASRPNVDAGEAPVLAEDVGLILAGHGEGRALRDLYEFLRDKNEIAAINYPFKSANGRGTLISARDTPEPVDLAGIKVTVVGPLQDDVEALQKEFDKYIRERGLTAEAMLAAYADKSVPNLSSIVCVMQIGSRRMLLTGDARGDKIVDGLSRAGFLRDGGKLKLDILKVPHHGSARNLTADFFNKITANTYIISASGRYANPDRESMEWLIASRSKDDVYEVVLTYDVASIDKLRKTEIQKKRPWNANKDSLKALFDQKQNDGYRFIVKAGSPLKIDLGDEKVKW
jgi:hypothetical protein